MPFYEYKCSNCGFELEELQKMSDPPLTKCPDCGKDTLQKLIGTGGGLIFKGSGFYLTDYKKKSTTESASAKSPNSEKSKTGSSKQDSSKGGKEIKPAEKKTGSQDTKKTENTKKDK